MAAEKSKSNTGSTQNNQYDEIGTKYNSIKVLPAAEPEVPSVVKALGNIQGKRCLDLACGTGKLTHLLHRLGASSVTGYDISSTMIDSARETFPKTTYPSLAFEVRDCSVPEKMKHDQPFEIVFAGWFFNYAGTERELTAMLRVVELNLAADGKFVGITTNVDDPCVKEPKLDFYGIDVLVLEREYIAPDTGNEVGIKARVVVKGDTPFSFDVFEFRKEVYERCAEKAGLKLTWGELVLPDDERRSTGYWDRCIERPVFSIVEAVRA